MPDPCSAELPPRVSITGSFSPGAGASSCGELAFCSHRLLREVLSNQNCAGRGGPEKRAVCFLLNLLADFSMEEIYAKFVSQKISKTRWRPVPSGSLQTAETFATGSWDNEVPRPARAPAALLHAHSARARKQLLASQPVSCSAAARYLRALVVYLRLGSNFKPSPSL